MSIADTIQPTHLRRLAVVYVRQSSPHQPLLNQESLKLQYALRDRARDVGWDPTQTCVIDTDLGCSARSSQGRPGFQELVTLVTLEQVGIIFAYDVTRLARNCTDWYQLLDLCGYRQCLVGDQDGIYDPATPNGRLILVEYEQGQTDQAAVWLRTAMVDAMAPLIAPVEVDMKVGRSWGGG